MSIGNEWLPSWTENRPQRHDLATQRRQEATDDHMRDSDAPLPRKLLKLIIQWKRSGAFVDSLQWALGRQDAENSSFWPVPARCGFPQVRGSDPGEGEEETQWPGIKT